MLPHIDSRSQQHEIIKKKKTVEVIFGRVKLSATR